MSLNILPLVGFYWKHGTQITALLPKSTAPGQPSLLLDMAVAASTVVKKHWPQLNANNLIDDGVAALRESLQPAAAVDASARDDSQSSS